MRRRRFEAIQNSEDVLEILEEILCKIKLSNPSIKHDFIPSENAGYYHSAQSNLCIYELSKKTGIKIRGIELSDSQGGKGYFLLLFLYLAL